MQHERSEPAQERRIALYKSDRQTDLFYDTVRAGQQEVVLDSVEGFFDQALDDLVHQEDDVLGSGALHLHQQLTVTEATQHSRRH